MKRACAFAALAVLIALGVACGETLSASGDEADASTTVDGSDGTSDADRDGAANDAGAAFCEKTPGAFACEDFERALPPSRGFDVETSTSGPAFTMAAPQPFDGAHSGQVALASFDAGVSYARLHCAPPAGKSKYHLEVQARLDRSAPGDVEIAQLTLYGTDGKSIAAHVTVRPGNGAAVAFCATASSCPAQNAAASFLAWTRVAIDLALDGTMRVQLDDVEFTAQGAVLPALDRAAAAVGVVSAFASGGERALSFDDALVTGE